MQLDETDLVWLLEIPSRLVVQEDDQLDSVKARNQAYEEVCVCIEDMYMCTGVC